MHTGKAKLDTVAPDARGVGRCGCRGTGGALRLRPPHWPLLYSIRPPAAGVTSRVVHLVDSIRSLLRARLLLLGQLLTPHVPAAARPCSRVPVHVHARHGAPVPEAIWPFVVVTHFSPARRSPQAAQAYPARANATCKETSSRALAEKAVIVTRRRAARLHAAPARPAGAARRGVAWPACRHGTNPSVLPAAASGSCRSLTPLAAGAAIETDPPFAVGVGERMLPCVLCMATR